MNEPLPPIPATAPIPTALVAHGASRVLEVAFDDGMAFRIPFELLRVCSPSAEVQGHGPGQQVPQTGKRDVTILKLEPIGQYAVQPTFSDGHDTGLYTWETLYRLGLQQERLWHEYLARLAAAGLDRDAPMPGAGRSAAAAHVHGPGCAGSH